MEGSLMELFSNPSTFDSLSTGEKMAGAGITTLMGMGITFCVLALLWGIIVIMSKITGATINKSATSILTHAAPSTMASATPIEAVGIAGTPIPKTESAELIAVITAAIAAYEGDSISSNLVVKRISRVSGATTAWSSAGHMESLESRRI